MNPPRLSQSDDGIVMNKTLAWSVFLSILMGALWLNTQVNSAQVRLAYIEAERSEMRSTSYEIDRRLRNLEAFVSVTETRLDTVQSGVQRIELLLERRDDNKRLKEVDE